MRSPLAEKREHQDKPDDRPRISFGSLRLRLMLLVLVALLPAFGLAFNTDDLTIGVMAGLALAAAWLGSELFVLRPVKTLERAISRLLEGDASVRNGLSALDREPSELAHAFDKMAASLEHSQRQRHWAEAMLRAREKQYRTVISSLKEVIFQTDTVGLWTFLNPAWTEMTGFAIAESIRSNFLDYIHPDDRQDSLEKFQGLIAGQKHDFCYEVRYLTKDGSYRWVEMRVHLTLAADGTTSGTSGTLDDITARKQAEEQLQQRTFYDAVTGLPNRVLFLARLSQLIEQAKQDERLFAVLLLDLDRFEVVKYSLGHFIADDLLIATARKLQARLNPTDVLARVGSNEFAMLLVDIKDSADATSIAEDLNQELTSPFDLDGREVFSTASIGIVVGVGSSPHPYSIVYDRPEDFLRAADTALHQAKQAGKACYAVFEPTMHVNAIARLQLETDLRRAIEHQQFQVRYQPIVSLQTGRITGFEALVRWIHPTRGTIPPSVFIPLAEETGLISLIDRWVLREACHQLSIWQQAFPAEVPLTMSVNLSGFQLGQLSVIERLDQTLRETGIEQRSLRLEITESVIMKNAYSATTILEQMKALGIQLSIDDFGTGYSSLERLHQLPIDTLKIDRSFVNRLDVDAQSWEIIRTIAALAANLGMEVIAEGVETAQQLDQLRVLKYICQYGQGYFFSRPVDSKTAGELLAVGLQW